MVYDKATGLDATLPNYSVLKLVVGNICGY